MRNAKIYALARTLGGKIILIVMVICVSVAHAGPSYISKNTTLYKYLMKFGTAEQTTAVKSEAPEPDTPPADIPAPPVKSPSKTNERQNQKNPRPAAPAPARNYKRAPYKGAPYKRAPRAADLSDLTEDTTFAAAVDMLINSVEPRLPLVVLWNDLEENAGIDKDTPAGIRAVPGVSLRKHLELLLLSVSAKGVEKLGYSVEGGVITIATVGTLPNKMSTRSYHIGELSSSPSTGFGNMGMGNMGMGNMGMGMGMGNMGMGMGMGNMGMGYGNYGSYGNYGNQRAGQLMNSMQPFMRPRNR